MAKPVSSLPPATRKSRSWYRIPPPNLENVLVLIALFAVIAISLCQLYPQVASRVPTLNDNVLHAGALGQTIVALATGQDSTDPWIANIALGYPLFHYYQHLPYLLPAVLSLPLVLILRLSLSPADLLNGISFLLLSLFPLSIYWAMRRFGFARLPSALAALVAPLLATNGLYGLDDASYLWRGVGLYTQLWGMVLLPPTLAQSYVTLTTGRGYFRSVLLLAATLLSHVVMGYIAVGSIILFAFLVLASRTRDVKGSFWPRLTRALVLLLLAAIVISYFVVPFVIDNAYLNRSVWEEATKYNSFGLPWVLSALVRGELFDAGRWPSLTLLAALGLLVCLARWREERYRIPVALAVLWLVLYFGRPTWGVLIDFLPMSGDLPLHRLIAGVHLGGILLMGLGLALPWQWALAKTDRRYMLIPAALTVLLQFPVYSERARYMAMNSQWMAEQATASAAEQKDVDALIRKIEELPPGRVYAGLRGKWGDDYRVGYVPMYALLTAAGLDVVGIDYHALSLNADIQVLFNDGLQDQYNVFNVRYVVTPTDFTVPAFYKPIQDFGRHRLYQIETTGYFDLVNADLAFSGGKSDWLPATSAWLASDEPTAKEHPAIFLGPAAGDFPKVLPLSQAPAVIAATTLPREPNYGRVLTETVSAGVYQAKVQATRASMVMLKATFHPNWHAYVDDVPSPTVMLAPSYMGVRVPEGTHQVYFEYRPSPLRGYLIIVGVLTLVLIAIAEHRRGPLPSLVRWMQLDRVRTVTTPVQSTIRRFTWLGRRAASRLESHDVTFTTKLGIYLLFLGVYLISATGHFWSTDHVAVYLTTQSLVENHSLAIKPIHDTAIGQDGKAYAVFGLGQSVLSIPLYLIGKAVNNIGSTDIKHFFGGVDLGDWGGTVPIFFVSLLNQFLTPLTSVIVFLFCLRLGVPRQWAFLTTLIYGFGTAAWVSAHEYFQHPLETLLLLSSVYILFSNKAHLEPRHALLAGMALGYGILTRVNLLIVAPALAVYLYVMASDPAGRLGPSDVSPEPPPRASSRAILRGVHELLSGHANAQVRLVLMFSLPIAIALALILYMNYFKFGGLYLVDPVHARLGFSIGNLFLALYGNLFSVGRSIFLYSPPTLLFFMVLRRFWYEFRAEALLFLAIALTWLSFYSSYGDWAGGWSWGPRFLVAILPFLVIPIGLGLGIKGIKVAAIVLGMLGVGIQILGVTVNVSYVTWDWLGSNLNPQNAYLFVPDISPIPVHFQALLAGRHIDLWLAYVGGRFGMAALLATLLLPTAVLILSFRLLKHEFIGRSIARAGVTDLSRVL